MILHVIGVLVATVLWLSSKSSSFIIKCQFKLFTTLFGKVMNIKWSILSTLDVNGRYWESSSSAGDLQKEKSDFVIIFGRRFINFSVKKWRYLMGKTTLSLLSPLTK